MNGIYLNLLLNEIEDKVIGRYIDEIRIKQRLLQIVFGKQALFISLYPEMLAMYLSEREKTGFEKLEKFSRPTASNRIIAVKQSGFMPVLRFVLEKNHTELILSFYREAPNFVVRTKKLEKKLYKRYIEKEPRRTILDAPKKELESIYKKDPKTFSEFLLREFEGLDKNLSRELTPKRIEQLKKVFLKRNASSYILSINPFQMSLFISAPGKEYNSLNDLFKDGFEQFMTLKDSESDLAHRKALIKNIERRLARLQKTILEDDKIESYRVNGELILINLAKIKKGLKHLTVKDPYTGKETMVELDPGMTPQENAEHYFSEYKKIKRGLPKIKENIRRLEDEITRLKDPSFELPALPRTSPKEVNKSEPYRIFKLPSGSIIYTGRNARSNNELTFAFARPNDYFFHIRNYEGAHVILRAKIPRGQRPNKKDIEGAAAIAAYFSKAKKQTNVPVSYTQRKYLKKNKKGKPGSVILLREEVVFVDPALPTDRGEQSVLLFML